MENHVVLQHSIKYGMHYFYPINSTAQKLLDLVSVGRPRKTFDMLHVNILRDLGFEIVINSIGFDSGSK